MTLDQLADRVTELELRASREDETLAKCKALLDACYETYDVINAHLDASNTELARARRELDEARRLAEAGQLHELAAFLERREVGP